MKELTILQNLTFTSSTSHHLVLIKMFCLSHPFLPLWEKLNAQGKARQTPAAVCLQIKRTTALLTHTQETTMG